MAVRFPLPPFVSSTHETDPSSPFRSYFCTPPTRAVERARPRDDRLRWSRGHVRKTSFPDFLFSSILSSFTRIQREDFQSFHSFFPPFILLPSAGRASTGIPNWLETFLNRGTGPVSFSSPAVDPHDPEYPPPPPPPPPPL